MITFLIGHLITCILIVVGYSWSLKCIKGSVPVWYFGLTLAAVGLSQIVWMVVTGEME